MDENIVNSVDANLFSLFEDMALANGGRFDEGEHWSAVDVGIASWGRVVLRPRFSKEEELGLLKAAMREGRIPNKLMTGPLTVPRNIKEWLLSQGFESTGAATGMALCKEDFTSSLKRPKDLELVELEGGGPEGEAGLAWASLVTEHLFGRAGGEGSEDFIRALGPRLGSSLRCFLGYSGGENAGASAMFHDGKSAGVYFVAVDPKFRNKGFGYELTAAATRAAFEEGYPFVILQATEMGKPIYQRMGYRETGVLGRFRLPS
jgi:ribosomal protein S18 acetylase RimI-like enzyme